MKIKHKLLSDYQYITNDKKIFLIKSGTIIEEYLYKLKGEKTIIIIAHRLSTLERCNIVYKVQSGKVFLMNI